MVVACQPVIDDRRTNSLVRARLTKVLLEMVTDDGIEALPAWRGCPLFTGKSVRDGGFFANIPQRSPAAPVNLNGSRSCWKKQWPGSRQRHQERGITRIRARGNAQCVKSHSPYRGGGGAHSKRRRSIPHRYGKGNVAFHHHTCCTDRRHNAGVRVLESRRRPAPGRVTFHAHHTPRNRNQPNARQSRRSGISAPSARDAAASHW